MAVTLELVSGAQAIQKSMGIPASVVMAQYFLESGDRPDKQGGASALAAQYNNYFGIKGTGSAGSVKMPTTEHGSGGAYTTTSQFAAYETPADGIAAYAKVIANKLISPYLEGAVTVEDYVQGIHASPYATDTSYDDKLWSIINKYDLTKYDTEYHAFDKSGVNRINPTLPALPSDKLLPSAGVSGSIGSGVAGTETGWKEDAEEWAVDYIAEPLTTTVFVILFAVLAVVFFMRAFPATGTAVETVKQYTTKRRKKGSEA